MCAIRLQLEVVTCSCTPDKNIQTVQYTANGSAQGRFSNPLYCTSGRPGRPPCQPVACLERVCFGTIQFYRVCIFYPCTVQILSDSIPFWASCPAPLSHTLRFLKKKKKKHCHSQLSQFPRAIPHTAILPSSGTIHKYLPAFKGDKFPLTLP